MCIEHAREHRNLDLSAEILKLRKEHGVALLGREAFGARQNSTDTDKLTILTDNIWNLSDREQGGECIAVIIQRVPCDVEPRRLFLPCQTLTCRARRNVLRNTNLLNLLHRFLAKKPALPTQQVTLPPCCILYRRIERSKQLIALRTDAVKCTTFDEALNRPLVDRPQVDTRTEVHKRAELSAL